MLWLARDNTSAPVELRLGEKAVQKDVAAGKVLVDVALHVLVSPIHSVLASIEVSVSSHRVDKRSQAGVAVRHGLPFDAGRNRAKQSP